MSGPVNTLVLAWGNPGRGDDGLGPELARAVEAMQLPGVTVRSGYQLQVEDAAEVADFDRVVFVDADLEGVAPFSVREVPPVGRAAFSTHSLSPEAVLAWSRQLYGAAPEAWLVGVRGERFDEFGEGLSATARDHLAAAAEFLCSALDTGRFELGGEP